MQVIQETLGSLIQNPVFVGEVVTLLLILLLSGSFAYALHQQDKRKKQSAFSLFVDWLFDGVYQFFEDILGEGSPQWIKSYVVNLFIVILFANIVGLFIDILIFPFPALEQVIQSPTTDITFTLALAIVSVLLLIVLEWRVKGGRKFILNYFPVLGRNTTTISKSGMSRWAYYLLFPFVKLFDIVLSFFLAILDIVGLLAKVISLAFRLYGNMFAGSILIAIVVTMIANFSASLFSGVNLPLLVPLIFYLQNILVAVIQALVFTLLLSVFAKVILQDAEDIQTKKRASTKGKLIQQVNQS